ncbi:uncharacterized protein VTP21DRAFT_2581 [Calcarisporiella thermophila]|uniref:uncharacterized protein n=1 Tax=Calcarisporiella thermophila TaxID=911321 RepID=UPI003743AB88
MRHTLVSSVFLIALLGTALGQACDKEQIWGCDANIPNDASAHTLCKARCSGQQAEIHNCGGAGSGRTKCVCVDCSSLKKTSRVLRARTVLNARGGTKCPDLGWGDDCKAHGCCWAGYDCDHANGEYCDSSRDRCGYCVSGNLKPATSA